MFNWFKRKPEIIEPVDGITPAALRAIAIEREQQILNDSTWSQDKLDRWYIEVFSPAALYNANSGIKCVNMWNIKHNPSYDSVSWSQRKNYLRKKGFSVDDKGGEAYVFWN